MRTRIALRLNADSDDFEYMAQCKKHWFSRWKSLKIYGGAMCEDYLWTSDKQKVKDIIDELIQKEKEKERKKRRIVYYVNYPE